MTGIWKIALFCTILVMGPMTSAAFADITSADNVQVTGTVKTAPAHLSREMLMGGPSYPAPVDFTTYGAPATAAKPDNHFEGRLAFSGKRLSGGFKLVRDEFNYIKEGVSGPASLPPFDFEFIQSGGDLIPRLRGAIAGPHSDWEYILEPGRVWQEDNDEGYSRAALPFSLQEKNMNCTHNGVLTFLFRDDGQMSNVAFQIASETCQYFKFDMWGLVAATYAPQAVEGKSDIIAAYRQEVTNRLPTWPIEQLEQDYPEVSASNFGSTSEVPAEHMTAFGFVIDGKHYVGGCGTRYGSYPYCDVLDLPSFSMAKSLVGGLALLRMEHLFPGIKDEKISAYVPQCQDQGTWDEVTFHQALEMTTGHYGSVRSMVDEDGPKMSNFFAALDHEAKIRLACGNFRHRTRPGERFVYQTSATYILGTALNAYLKQKNGPDADLYRDILVEPVWKPLGLGPITWGTRRTYDDTAQPFVGWGLTFHRGDVARIGDFLSRHQGILNGQQVFDDTELQATLQRMPGDRGRETSGDNFRYRGGFWAWNGQEMLGCKDATWIPFMSGYGGITLALLPNGTAYYYFSDNHNFAWGQAAIESDKIHPLCQKEDK